MKSRITCTIRQVRRYAFFQESSRLLQISHHATLQEILILLLSVTLALCFSRGLLLRFSCRLLFGFRLFLILRLFCLLFHTFLGIGFGGRLGRTVGLIRFGLHFFSRWIRE